MWRKALPTKRDTQIADSAILYQDMRNTRLRNNFHARTKSALGAASIKTLKYVDYCMTQRPEDIMALNNADLTLNLNVRV